MRTIIRQKRRTGREVTEWLTVIDEFDQLVADRAPLERLVEAATRITDRRACVLDALNGRLCAAEPGEDGSISDPPGAYGDVISGLTATRLRGRETGIVTIADTEVVAASVDDAGRADRPVLARARWCALETTRRARRPAPVLGCRDQQRPAQGRARDARPPRLRGARTTALGAAHRGGRRRGRPTGRASAPVVRSWRLPPDPRRAATSVRRRSGRRSRGRSSRRGCPHGRP